MKNEHIPVFYEGNDDYIEMLSVSMISVLYNTKSFIDFYILDCGICPLNKKILETLHNTFNNFTIKYIPIDLKKFSHLKGYRNGFLDCYARLLIPELNKEIKRAIYFDFDILLLDDIKKLWEQDLGEYELGAVPDLGYSAKIAERCLMIGISQQQLYANAGTLLIDCEKWRENNVSEKLLDIAFKIKEKILFICEDILNLYYNNNTYKILDMRYNMRQMPNEIGKYCAPDITDEYLKQEWKEICVLHWTIKPWFSVNYYNDELRFFSLFYFFAKQSPWYEGLVIKFIKNQRNMTISQIQQIIDKSNNTTNKASPTTKKIKLFGIIPLITAKRKGNITHYKLFNIIPLLKKVEK